MDVFEGEPTTGVGTVDNPLISLPGVIGTHHIGGATLQAHRSIADETVRIVLEFAASGVVLNAVGMRGYSLARSMDERFGQTVVFTPLNGVRVTFERSDCFWRPVCVLRSSIIEYHDRLPRLVALKDICEPICPSFSQAMGCSLSSSRHRLYQRAFIVINVKADFVRLPFTRYRVFTIVNNPVPYQIRFHLGIKA